MNDACAEMVNRRRGLKRGESIASCPCGYQPFKRMLSLNLEKLQKLPKTSVIRSMDCSQVAAVPSFSLFPCI